MRTIKMSLSGDAATLDSTVAGVQGSGNVDTIDLTFDAGWDGYAKTVTWWDALGQNPVKRTLTTDLIPDITADTRRYRVSIPPEPLAAAGRCQMVVDGYVEGKRARSVCVELDVLYAPASDNAGESADPTPTQAEQLQAEIDDLLSDLATISRQEKEQALARVQFLRRCWDEGEWVKAYRAGYETVDGERELFFSDPYYPKPDFYNHHPVTGGEYKVTVTRGSETVVGRYYYTGDPFLVDGVTIGSDLSVPTDSDADSVIVEYVQCTEDVTFCPKDHLDEVNSAVASNAAKAKTSEENAKASEDAAKTSEDAAKASEQNAAASAETATERANAAETYAQEAGEEAAAAAGSAAAAQGYARSAGEEAERAADRATAAYDSKAAAQAAEQGAVSARDDAQSARDDAEAAQSAAEAAQTAAQSARDEAVEVLPALHLRERVYAGPASMMVDMLPGDVLIVTDGGDLVAGVNYQDLLEEARKAAAGEENELESKAVLSAVNATNWRQDEAGTLWTTDKLADFRSKLTAFAGAAVAGGYVDSESGKCTATWAQVQYWLIHGTLTTPLEADNEGYTWRTEPPKTRLDALAERVASVEQMLDQTASIFGTLANGG